VEPLSLSGFLYPKTMKLFLDNTTFSNSMWVIIDNEYLYLHRNIFCLFLIYIFERNHDKHLVG